MCLSEGELTTLGLVGVRVDSYIAEEEKALDREGVSGTRIAMRIPSFSIPQVSSGKVSSAINFGFWLFAEVNGPKDELLSSISWTRMNGFKFACWRRIQVP